jgi:predicted Ser/Thr protein kinase
MPTPPEQDDEQLKDQVQASTPQLDRLESLAKAATANVQSKQWRARKNGLQEQEEPSEVRNLTHDAEARAQAEAAMQLMGAAKPKGKPRGRW